jgi:hypothetical protein
MLCQIRILLLFVFGNSLLAQEMQTGVIRYKEQEFSQKVFVTAGPELSLTLPTEFGSSNRKQLQDTLFIVNPEIRFRVGCALRVDFSKTFSLRTGLYYISRQHQFKVGISDAIGQVISSEIYSNSINYIGYEIPAMLLAYARLGENVFLNNSIGFSFDFFPSSAQKLDPNEAFKMFVGRNSWIVPSLKASIGFEYRSMKNGYFYFGGNFHQPFFSIADLFVERNNPAPFGLQAQKLPLSGTYFSLDAIFYLPPGKENKWLK